MASLDLHDIKKQTALFFREKFKGARLALTDVTRIQLLTEEATNSDPWGPETRTMAALSDAAYDRDEYERIVQVLHSRLEIVGKRCWRQVYKTLVVLEYLLTHGPGSLVNDFRCDKVCIEELCQFNFVDQQGIDRGLSVRKKADRVLELLNKTEIWKQERNRAQKISYGIQGFGSNIKKESHNLAAEGSEDKLTVEVSEVNDAEGQSTVSLLDEKAKVETKVDNHTSKNHLVEWHPFEKSLSSPGYVMHRGPAGASNAEVNVESSTYREHNSEFAAGWHPFKKSLSSPHFRDSSQSDWHPFVEEFSERDATGVLLSDSSRNNETDLLKVLKGHKGACIMDGSPSVNLQENEQQYEKNLHAVSVSPMHGLHPSERKCFSQMEPCTYAGSSADWWALQKFRGKNPSTSPTMKQNKNVTLVNPASTLHESRDSEQFVASKHVSKRTLQPHAFSKLPLLPPPPHAKSGTKLQHHRQLPSLLDL